MPIDYSVPEPAPREERVAAIGEAVARAGGRTEFVPFRDGYIEAPVASVDEALLLYRADNGRLFSELAARGIERVQREDREQQAALHALLLDKARDSAGPIFAELEAHATQTAPLLVTADGITVNGNRRLASMRALIARDRERFGEFARVLVAVLPADLSAGDIEYIEAALQMAPDLKLEYSWINRRLTLRDQRERLGLGDDALVAAYRLADAGRIDIELSELALAEAWLRYLGAPADYARVIEDEELFAGFAGELREIGGARIETLWRHAGFAMLAARDAIDRPLDHFYPFTAPKPAAMRHWVLHAMAEAHGLIGGQPPGDAVPLPAGPAAALDALLGDRSLAESNAREVVALIDTLRANQGELLGARQAINHLRRANDSLRAVDMDALSERQRLDIATEIRALRDWLARFEGGEREPESSAGPGLLERLIGRA